MATTVDESSELPELAIFDELAALMASVRLLLEPDGDAFVVSHDGQRFSLESLPLTRLDPAARRAELLAVAAGFDAAIKGPAQPNPGETFAVGAQSLLPKVERARFVDAYHRIVAARGGGDLQRLLWRPLGADLVICYVSDEEWRMTYMTEEVRHGWGASPDTVAAAARSSLYARCELDEHAGAVATGDYYDGSRVTILGDRYFHRADGAGIVCAVPGRDKLLIGAASATTAASAEAYERAKYPLSPYVLRWAAGRVQPIDRLQE